MKYLRNILVVIILALSISINLEAQDKVYLPIIFSNGKQIMEYPILSISNGTDTINLLDPGSGLQLDNPYWQPNIAQLKGGGSFVNPSNADGQALVSANYDNVIETIPIRITGVEGYKTVENLRKLLQMSVNAQNYYTASFEQNQVYMAIKAKGDNFLTAYAAIYTISVPNITNPYGAPFVNDIDYSSFDTINIIINREPFFHLLPKNNDYEFIHNMITNSYFDEWGINPLPTNWDDNGLYLTEFTRAEMIIKKENNPYGLNSLVINVPQNSLEDFLGIAPYNISMDIDTDESLSQYKTYTIGAILKIHSLENAELAIKMDSDHTIKTYYPSDVSNDLIFLYEVFEPDATEVYTLYFDITGNINKLNKYANVEIFYVFIMEGEFDNIEYLFKNNALPFISFEKITNEVGEGFKNYIELLNVKGDISATVSIDITNNQTFDNDNPSTNVYNNVYIGGRHSQYIDNYLSYVDFNNDIIDNTLNGNKYNQKTDIDINWTMLDTVTITNTDYINKDALLPLLVIRDTYNQDDLQLRLKVAIDTDEQYIIYNPINIRHGQWINIPIISDNFIQLYDIANSNFVKIVMEIKRANSGISSVVDYDIVYFLPSNLGFYRAEDLSLSVLPQGHLTIENFENGIVNKVANPTTSFNKELVFTMPFVNDIFDTFYPFFIYNQELYLLGPQFLAPVENHVYKTSDGDTWNRIASWETGTEPFPGGAETGDAIFFNGILYCFNYYHDLDKSTNNGNGWQTVETDTGATPSTKLLEYNNQIWWFASETELITSDVFPYSYNGSVLTKHTSASITGRSLIKPSSVLYKNNMIITYGGNLYSYDFSNTLTQIQDDVINDITLVNLIVYNNLVYTVGIENNKLYIFSYDGENITKITNDNNAPITTIAAPDYPILFIEANGYFYLGGRNELFVITNNFQTWTKDNSVIMDWYSAVFWNDYLYFLGSGPDGGTEGAIYRINPYNIFNAKITNYNGGNFIAIPYTSSTQKKQRYYFVITDNNDRNDKTYESKIKLKIKNNFFSLINKDTF